ncbi:MAG: GspH/FimT family pseudopilin [Woeseiaceae bacterium]|nr:GspH/FimT family pseudopilin [Woeseiaceae bacterium]
MLQPNKNAGFTLYELMVTVTVAAIIASFAVPGFQNLVSNNRSVTHTNDFVTALNLARSEATRRRFPIDVCASADGATCSGSNDWSTGWIVRTPAGQVLQAWPARSGGAGVLSGNVSNIQFQASGSLPAGANPLISLQLPRCKDPGRRNITISPAGRIAVTRVACT